MVTDSVIHAHKRLRTIRSSTHRKYQSTIQHSTKFKFQFSTGSPPPTHRLRTPTTPTITHIHNTPRKPSPTHYGFGVKVSDNNIIYYKENIRCDVINPTAAPYGFGEALRYHIHYYRDISRLGVAYLTHAIHTRYMTPCIDTSLGGL